MDNNRYIMDPRYTSSSSSRITRAMIGNMPGLETDIYSYPTSERGYPTSERGYPTSERGYPTSERGYHDTFVERPTVDSYYSHYDLVKLMESSPYSIDPRTPLKANFEEDTLVLDAIPVEYIYGGSSSGNNHNRRSAYRSAEDISSSIAGSKYRGPHSHSSRGKEERRSHYNPKNNFHMPVLSADKWEALSYIFGPLTPQSAPAIPKTPSSANSRMAPAIPKSPSSANSRMAPAIPKSPSSANSRTAWIVTKTPRTVVPFSPRSELVTKKTPSSSNAVISSDWSPLDDGIMVNLPSNPNNPPTRAEFESHYQKVLNGPSTRKRLPVFEQICSP